MNHDAAKASARREHHAILMLLIACAFWGFSFNWNKTAQALLGQRLAETTADPRLHAVGPAAFLAARFLATALLWSLLFPRSLRGWTPRTVRASLFGGALLSGGMLFQHYGLVGASESLMAFLTSLTVLFTPVLASLVLGHRVAAMMWVSVACATLGVALMSHFRAEGRFDLGATLGLICALVFSVHILVVDHYGKTEDVWRFSLGQFAASALFISLFSLLQPGGGQLLHPRIAYEALASPQLLTLLALTILFSTIVTFGLMFRYQPRTSPTRAALTYLSEPIFATLYAWIAAGSAISPAAMAGAAFIILGNLVAELVTRRPAPAPRPRGEPP